MTKCTSQQSGFMNSERRSHCQADSPPETATDTTIKAVKKCPCECHSLSKCQCHLEPDMCLLSDIEQVVHQRNVAAANVCVYTTETFAAVHILPYSHTHLHYHRGNSAVTVTDPVCIFVCILCVNTSVSLQLIRSC